MALIIYDLECEYSHRFEGWFRSLDDFEDQRGQQLLQCPTCGSSHVRKVPSRLNIAGSKSDASNISNHQSDAEATRHSGAINVTTAFVMAKQALIALINHSEDVGSRFAEEARKIHYEEAPARAIRGQASPEEFEELRDEGIDIIALPMPDIQDELN